MTVEHGAAAALSAAERRDRLVRRIRLLTAATISYNVLEAGVALGAGAVASSSALVGFGLDSVVEVFSAAAVAWQFSARDPQARERVALRCVAVAFFALAVMVSVGAGRALLTGASAEESTVGIVLAAVSLAVMPALSWAQRRTGRELGSRSAVADAGQTLLCTYLSAVLLAGLVLNATLGWAWADPVAALVIAAVAVREGVGAWRGNTCCSPVAAPAALRPDPRQAESRPVTPAGRSAGPSAGPPEIRTSGPGCSCCHHDGVSTAQEQVRRVRRHCS